MDAEDVVFDLACEARGVAGFQGPPEGAVVLDDVGAVGVAFQPVADPSFEYGSLDVIRTDAEGYVEAPPGPGLGIRTDWEAVERAAFLTYEIAGRE